MSKILLVINHPEEWNQLLPFNAFIHTLKPNYSKVIAAVQYNGYIVISEADELICEKENNFFKYPKMLDTSKREDNLFLEKCVNFCCEKYGKKNVDILSWRKTKYNIGIVNVNDVVDLYKKSFEYVKKYLDSGNTIKPTEKTFESVKKKYGHLFCENTFILLTRNFLQKAPVHNTKNSLPNLKKLLKHLTENNIHLINIGFPPESYNLKKNYLELNDELTQDELISLFYLSNGVLTAADAGGFLTHFGSNVDFYILNEEWSILHEGIKISLLDSKINNNTYNLVNKSDQEILNTLRKNGKSQISDFSNPKIIYFVEENKIMNKDILVTGGSGLVGSYLRKFIPNAIFLSSSDYNLTKESDVIKLFDKFKPKCVVHLAAKVGGIIDNIENPAEYFDDNILMNTFMLKYSRLNNVDRFIGILSTCIYPDKVDEYPMDESDLHLGPPTETNFSYGYSKRSLAVQIDSYNKQYGTKYQYLIPCNLYGVGDKDDEKKSHFLTALVRKIVDAKIKNETKIELYGDGTPLRQFLFAEDFAKIIYEVINQDIYESFNVAGDENLSIGEMVQIALRVCDAKDFKIIWNSEKPNGQFRKDVSNRKMKTLLSNMNFIGLEEGIKKVYESYYDKISQ